MKCHHNSCDQNNCFVVDIEPSAVADRIKGVNMGHCDHYQLQTVALGVSEYIQIIADNHNPKLGLSRLEEV